MRGAIAAFMSVAVWTVFAGMLDAVRAQQNDPVRPAVQTTQINPIGKVVTIVGVVAIEHTNAVVVQASVGSQPARPKIGDPVYQNDVVQTGADGRIGITFTDETAFNLSSNARLVLNEFVYDPNGTSNTTLFKLTKGTFTFIAGKVAKTGEMKIETPVATMGIRGTTPHVEIRADGSVRFLTLIEKPLSKGSRKRGASSNQRQTNDTSTPVPGSLQRPMLKIDNPNLTICRGC
jgi:hypothetical protein